MAFEELMGLSNRLLVHAQALAAVTARLRLDELGAEGDTELRRHLDRVADALGVRAQLDDVDERERSIVVSFARSYLNQALDLAEDPSRPSSWSYSDPVLLQAQGSASAVVARLIASAGLGSGDARILDVGTGVAGLAIAFCTTFPASTVVGLDPWQPALELARENIRAAGLESRISLRATPVQELDDADEFDLTWLPSFFIPEAVLDAALDRIFAASRTNGVVVVGSTHSLDSDPLSSAVDDLFTVRSGGSVVDPAEAILRLERAGFTDAHELERTWEAPLRLVAGRRAD